MVDDKVDAMVGAEVDAMVGTEVRAIVNAEVVSITGAMVGLYKVLCPGECPGVHDTSCQGRFLERQPCPGRGCLVLGSG